jgi:hypothetical protein
VAGCCECGDEPSGSCATELVNVIHLTPIKYIITTPDLLQICHCDVGDCYSCVDCEQLMLE